MPYKNIGKIVFVKKGEKWVKKATAKSVASAKRMVNLLRGIKHGFTPTRKKVFRRIVDRRMRDYGEIDFSKKTIRVNPRRTGQGGIVDTVIHEELHRRHPEKGEREIKRMTKKKVKEMSLSRIGDMFKKFREKSKRKIHYKTS